MDRVEYRFDTREPVDDVSYAVREILRRRQFSGEHQTPRRLGQTTKTAKQCCCGRLPNSSFNGASPQLGEVFCASNPNGMRQPSVLTVVPAGNHTHDEAIRMTHDRGPAHSPHNG